MADEKTRVCSRCTQDESKVEFYTSPNSQKYMCKPCWGAYQKESRGTRIERVRKQCRENMRRFRWGKLGLDVALYEKLLAKQEYKCAICGAEELTKEGGTLAVDHDHEDGQIRGLLCRACNLLLSKANDDIRVLANAVEYLERAQSLKT